VLAQVLILARTLGEAIDAADGYAAADLLKHRGPATAIIDQHRDVLTHLLTASGLGGKSLPPALADALTTSTQIAADVLARAVCARPT
jgi:hypothetical protein